MRASNFELLRILCMLGIVLGHIIMMHKGIMNLQNPTYWVDLILRPFVLVAVNTFILISGYWGIKFKLERLFKLSLQTWFYSVLIFFITLFLGWHSLSLKKDIGIFIPIFSKQYWFITAYFALYVLSPILNSFSNYLSQYNYKIVLGVGFLLFYIWPTTSYLINAKQLVNDYGHGIVNFIFLYLLGRYIRLHFLSNIEKSFYLKTYILCAILCFGLQLLLSVALGFEFTFWYSYNTIFVLGGAISIFLYFSKLHFYSTSINSLAKHCLAVYLIHTGPKLGENLSKVFNLKEYDGWQYILILILTPIVIYLLCILIERIRILIFGKIEDFIISKVSKTKYFIKIQTLMNHLILK